MAFVSALPGGDWPHLARTVHLAREFNVPVLFAIHFRDDEMCQRFVAETAAEGVSAEVQCPTTRGQRFAVTTGGSAR
jgi:hypothetical protein